MEMELHDICGFQLRNFYDSFHYVQTWDLRLSEGSCETIALQIQYALNKGILAPKNNTTIDFSIGIDLQLHLSMWEIPQIITGMHFTQKFTQCMIM